MRYMNVYVEMLLTAAAAVYVVDLSGFTDAWRAALARLLKIHPGESSENFRLKIHGAGASENSRPGLV